MNDNFGSDKIQQWNDRKEKQLQLLEIEYKEHTFNADEDGYQSEETSVCLACKDKYKPHSACQKYCRNKFPLCEVVAAKQKQKIRNARRKKVA